MNNVMKDKINFFLYGQFIFNLFLFLLMLGINDFFEGVTFKGMPLLFVVWFVLSIVMTIVILISGKSLLNKIKKRKMKTHHK